MPLAEAICTNSAHHCLIEPTKITKEISLIAGSVVWKVRRVALAFDINNQIVNPPFSGLTPLFLSHISLESI